MAQYQNTIKQLIKLQELLVQLGEVKRADNWPNAESRRKETVIEHSYFLAIVAWQTAEKLELDLSQEKILKYALIHDLPEAYAGDLPLFSNKEEHQKQQTDEKKAIDKIAANFPESSIPSLIKQSEGLQDPESQFVKAMDALIVLFVQITSNKTQFAEKNNQITQQDIEDILPKWREHTDISSEMTEFTNQLLEVWHDNVELYA